MEAGTYPAPILVASTAAQGSQSSHVILYWPEDCIYDFCGPKAGEGNGTPLQYACLEKSHGQRSLVGCRPWGREELDTTERLPFHFSLSCIGEGNGNPLQCSCLENPRDGKRGGLPSMGSHRVGHD